MAQPEMKFCQSCAHPLRTEEDKGTNADGTKNEEYCHYCYMNGEFTQTDISLEEMIELSAKGWSEADPNISYEEAKKQLSQMIPQLKRWRK